MHLIITKCEHLYKSRGFCILWVWSIQVCVYTMPQSSQEWASKQILTKVRLCNDQINCKKTKSYISDSTALSWHVECKSPGQYNQKENEQVWFEPRGLPENLFFRKRI